MVLFVILVSVEIKHFALWALVVAQWIEQSLPTPEIRGSNPVIDKILYFTDFTVNSIKSRNWPKTY